MPKLSEIDKYHKSGKGGMFQFYITDEELQNILTTELLKAYEPYSLISYIYDSNDMSHFKEMDLSAFTSYRAEKHYMFYLRSLKLSPQLDFPSEPIKGGHLRADYIKYFMYNGLINIQHGILIAHKYFAQSSIGIIDKYYHQSRPDEIYTNEEYMYIFKQLQSSIRKLLKHKGKQTMDDAKTYLPKTNNVSEGFAIAVETGKITTDLQIV